MIGLPCSYFEEKVFDAVRRAVRGAGCDCVALSGGIDTSVVALAARLEGLAPTGVTVFYSNGLPRDLPYADTVARVLGLRHVVVEIGDSYVASRAEFIVGCTGRRDYIELRNDAVFLAALEEAKKLGCRCMLLGDGGDEVFAGYRFMLTLADRELKQMILGMAVRGRYPGLELAECIGVDAVAPLLSDEVLEYVLAAPTECLRRRVDEGKELLRGILRRYGLVAAAERPKTPAEQGAGTDVLTKEVLEEITGVELGDCPC
jgi:asparagine synthase (glutamine-hydrolysing)